MRDKTFNQVAITQVQSLITQSLLPCRIVTHFTSGLPLVGVAIAFYHGRAQHYAELCRPIKSQGMAKKGHRYLRIDSDQESGIKNCETQAII